MSKTTCGMCARTISNQWLAQRECSAHVGIPTTEPGLRLRAALHHLPESIAKDLEYAQVQELRQ